MSSIGISFLLTSLAGLSTLLGMIFIFFKLKNENKIILASLSFASGVMLCVSITDLIPEQINLLSENFNFLLIILISFLSVFLGMLISYFIDKKVDFGSNNLYKVGIISMIAIIFHNIPEGIITFLTSTTNIDLGVSLTIAIAMHNIPEGIGIAIPIYYATKSKKKAFLYTMLSALSEPFGAFLAFVFLYKIINNTIMGILLGITAGIMIYISMFELLKTSIDYKNKKMTTIFFIIGIFFMLFKFFI